MMHKSESDTNNSITKIKVSDFSGESAGFDNTAYSFLDSDNTAFHQYIKMFQDSFNQDFFRDNLKFLKGVTLKCLPKVYFKILKFKHSDFKNCHKMNNRMINVFGKRIMDSCRESESFMACLTDARNKLINEYDGIEEDIMELYLDELIGRNDSCMKDILHQLHKLEKIVRHEC
ncbi:hypothetical protein HHI36_019731 [Cryptolaemus montrouzieri]|uniref:Uncharacterized protein n=1 Tax=Cryptolaemus montrouzieri TaxID=559131 RepID=A0ABD2N9A8_9CUCU